MNRERKKVMSEFKKDVMKTSRKSKDPRSFYEGMVYSYGQFYGVLAMFKTIEDANEAIKKMAEELDIPTSEGK